MYSNDQNQIKAGLVNYMGAMINASSFKDTKAARHSVVALVLEETLNLCKDEEGLYDLLICKPLLRANINILKQRINCLSELPQDTLIKDKINSYKTIINELEKILEIVKF